MAMARFLLVLSLLVFACPAKAQLLMSLFPEGVPGYGEEAGVTVKSRARPAFDPLGVRFGTLLVRPSLAESIGYDNNIFGGSARHGAWRIVSSPSVLAAIGRSDASVGFFASADDARYLGQPSQDRTDGSVFVGGTVDLGRDKLTLGAGYLARHEDRTALDALPSDKPVGFRVDNIRASYAADFGRVTLAPALDFNRWRFDNTTILGTPAPQSARDRTTLQGGLTIRYNWMAGRDFVLVSRLLDTRYDSAPPGFPTNNSDSWQTLFGVDWDDDTVWRFRALGGVQYRHAQASSIASAATAIAEGEIVWSPSGLTTVRGTLTRGIEDAAQSGLSSYTYTGAALTVDRELLRNVLLTASASVRHASFNRSGGEQYGFGAVAGAVWLINRHFRLSLTEEYTDVRNRHLPAGTVAGNYVRSLTLLTLRAAL